MKEFRRLFNARGSALRQQIFRNCLFGLATLVAATARPATVLMISVDGMKPEYVLQADAHGLRIPFLRSMLKDGTYARGVTGVWPTVTYPSHTTLVTGVAPAEHGIYNNLEYDPQHLFADAWYWYANQIRVPTLWDATHAAGLITASVGWPVTVGATHVDYLIPEYWRIFVPTADLNPSDANLIAALTRPEGMLTEMQTRLGLYMMGNDPHRPGDEIKTRYALDILRAHKPAFMTLHLSSLDEEEHEHGPFSAEANADLEAIDGWLAQLIAAAHANDPAAIAVVVSDHGFESIRHRVNLFLPLARAGLAQAAHVWPAGGMAAVLLSNSADAIAEQKVRDVLHMAAADPRNGIASILEREEISKLGGFPDAAFLIVMQAGYAVLSASAAVGVTDLVTDMLAAAGSHGFSPEAPEMRASFFAAGHGIARHRDLGIIDMRQIAPTVAQWLQVALPSTAAPLRVQP